MSGLSLPPATATCTLSFDSVCDCLCPSLRPRRPFFHSVVVFHRILSASFLEKSMDGEILRGLLDDSAEILLAVFANAT